MSHLPASLSLDLDNQWSYMKTHGDKGWETYPSYLDSAVPTILNTLDELDLKITFFIVGKDASLEKNHEAIRKISDAGHAIANHSFSHEPWFHEYTKSEIEDEVIRAEEEIEKVTGIRPRGWRGPGFSFSRTLLEVLAERNYLYDASVFPTFLGPIARIFYFLNSDLDNEDREQRKNLYGGIKDVFRPLKPFQWDIDENQSLLEIPVTTAPIFRTPVHGSYLLYLSKYSHGLAKAYFGSALQLHKLTGSSPSFLLHPTDFLGIEDVPELKYFPAMDQPREIKLKQIRHFLTQLKKTFDITPMENVASAIANNKKAIKRLNTMQQLTA